MLIYYITLFFVILFSLNFSRRTDCNSIQKGKQKTNNINIILIFSVFTFFAGFRWQVGSDWWAYYAQLNSDFVRHFANTWHEPGWYGIGYLSTLVYDHYGVAMFVAAAITIWLYIRTCAKYSPIFILSMLLFFFLVWHGCFNGVRQYLAAAVLFAGHRYILERKQWRWLVTVAIASLFHTTALLMFFWYFVATSKLNFRQVIIITACGIAAFFSYDLLFGFLGWYKGKALNMDDVYSSRSISVFRILTYWIPVLYYYFFIYTKQKQEYDFEINFYGNMILLSAVLMTAASSSAYLARIGIYTGGFLLLAWPMMIKKLDEKFRFFVTASVVFIYGVYWFYDIWVHPDLNNFQLFIGR